ncbi:hypothetical protein [Paenibacillus piri]|uniref:Alpha/beta hydrolase n=1 Tax=Paenibacillus piri TaxID=2547395 RepID=A0A4V2ZTD5_9BACL|nr:hypothetical protein [Paenibacillus piri]TDF96264.1 hypothetical protein E1757_17915 [Paenibacillus piri]
MSRTAKPISMYLLAGVATAPLFMEGLRHTMTDKLEQDGWSVQSELLYPYGDWNRRLVSQLREMSHDLWLVRAQPLRSIGGRRAADAIRLSSGGRPLLLIGHSGGGVAAVHAVQILAAEAARSTDAAGAGLYDAAARGAASGTAAADGHERLLPHRIVQIGSPKCPIPEWMRASVLYAGLLDAKGKPADPVTRLGSWSGWSHRNPGRLPSWYRQQFAPGAVAHFPIIGGHPDYFRENSPFINEQGRSNMDTTVKAVRSWLTSTFVSD